MKKYIYILIILIIFLTFNLNNVEAELNLTYNIDRINTEPKYRLNAEKTKLYIPEFFVKGIYVTGWAAGSSHMNNLIELADNTVINTMVIDIKDQDGYLTYISNLEVAKEIGADKQKVKNLPALIERLHSKGIYVIARIAVFKDVLLSRGRKDLALEFYNRETEEIIKSDSWVDPGKLEVWDYNITLARKAVAMGFDEIQFDYVRFPALGNSVLDVVKSRNLSKTEIINDFVRYSKDKLSDLNIPISVDVFGLTTTAKDDMGIGQNFTELSNIINIISPMVYPSHYSEGIYGIAIPELEPELLIYRSLYDASQKVKGNDKVNIRPWLQDFSLNHKYNYQEILAQIRAAENLGINEWLLWNPSSRYTEEAVKGYHF